MAQVIQASLADAGITVELIPLDFGSFWTLGDEKSGDRWKTVQLQLGRFSMNPDPAWATVWFTPEQIGVWNWERWNSPEFGRLHEQGLHERDPQKRDALYRHMQDLMEESGRLRLPDPRGGRVHPPRRPAAGPLARRQAGVLEVQDGGSVRPRLRGASIVSRE